jgi:hypothetical protein
MLVTNIYHYARHLTLTSGHRITAGYIGNIVWSPREDQRAWGLFRLGSDGYSAMIGHYPTGADLLDAINTNPSRFERWAAAPAVRGTTY